MDKRERYLSQAWNPYPTVPNPGWLGGELIFIEALTSGWNIKIRKQGHVTEIKASSISLATTDLKPTEVLVAGDKIALKANGETLELMLLSPCGEDRPLHRLGFEEAVGWQNFLALVRAFFKEKDFVEIATPSLVVCPGTEPTLDPISVQVKMAQGTVRRFLPTSPELHLKKLLCQGWDRIFEIRSCFRDGETSAHHEIEFTMLEFYRAFENLGAIQRDLESLLEQMKAAGMVVGNLEPSQRFRVSDLFKSQLGFNLLPTTSAEELRALCRDFGLVSDTTDTWNDLFHRLWLEKVEPWIAAQSYPVIVSDFPHSQAALARIGECGWAERFELFWRGLEIGNAFHELNNPEEQGRRFAKDLREKQALGKVAVPLDQDFMNALKSGMPPASGIAVGLERLYMAARKIDRIQRLKAFPYGD